MTEDFRVVRVRAYAVAPDGTPPTRYHGRMEPERMNAEIARVTLANGAEGAASSLSGWNGREAGWIARRIEPLADALLGADAARRSDATRALLAGAGAGPWEAVSMLDCAMWDAYARATGRPLWRLLGGRRERIPAYASTEAYLSIEEYLDATRRFVALGYRAVKFHMNTDPDFDLELVRIVTRTHGDGGIRFMTDQEQQQTFDEAARLGEAMSRGPFDWLEAPLPDEDLDAYVELNRAVGVDVLPAGNTLVGLDNWRVGLERKAWSRLRFDACNAGGITTAIEAVGLARAMGVPVEIQSFGFGPAQRTNLHVMLGLGGCTWFERPAPSAPWDYPVREPLALDAQGRVGAGEGPGLGADIDWRDVEANAVARFDSAA